MYESVLEQLMVESDRAQTRRLFQWVCLATRPLSVTEMRYALASHKTSDQSVTVKYCGSDYFNDSDEIMKSCIRSWSGGLIEVTAAVQSDVPVVQPIHQSVNDFCLVKGLELLTRHDTWRQDVAAPSTIDVPVSEIVANCHGELYWCCLKYMSEDAVGCVSIDLSSYDWDQKVRYRSDMRARFSLLEYVSLNYLTHAKNAHRHRSRDLSVEAQVITRCAPILTHAKGVFSFECLRYNRRFEPYVTPLHIAAATGLIDLTRHLLEHVIDVDSVDINGKTALHVAAEQGHLAVVEILIDNKACVQKVTDLRATPLLSAAREGYIEVFSLLMKQGARIGSCADSVNTALCVAASHGKTAITRLCIEVGADVNDTKARYGTALQVASANGHTEVVQMLLAAGADVNAPARIKRGTALQKASKYGHEEVVQMLLVAGADVNSLGRLNGTALQVASTRGHVEVVQMLLAAGADVNAPPGERNGNALQAASREGYTEIVRMLLTAGADVNDPGGRNETALDMALGARHEQIVQILLDAGARTSSPSER